MSRGGGSPRTRERGAAARPGAARHRGAGESFLAGFADRCDPRFSTSARCSRSRLSLPRSASAPCRNEPLQVARLRFCTRADRGCDVAKGSVGRSSRESSVRVLDALAARRGGRRAQLVAVPLRAGGAAISPASGRLGVYRVAGLGAAARRLAAPARDADRAVHVASPTTRRSPVLAAPPGEGTALPPRSPGVRSSRPCS